MSDDPNDEANWSPALRQAVADLNAQDEQTRRTSYGSRSAAVRAARAACRQVFGPVYVAFEGPDYYIHPVGPACDLTDRYRFELSPMVQQEADANHVTITAKGFRRI